MHKPVGAIAVVTVALLMALSPAAKQPKPRFTVAEAIQAEFMRKPPVFTPEQVAALSEADRARLDLTLRRIGAPGAPALLPPELEKPTEEAWLGKAAAARSPQERFTALHFLNRLKSPRALEALAGLTAADAASWPTLLHLENPVATARVNGAEVRPDLQAFLDAMAKAGKVDPARAQAARLRLVMAGKEKELLPPVEATPGAILAVMDAWNRAPWEQRRDLAFSAFKTLSADSPAWAAFGLKRPNDAALAASCTGVLSRLSEGTPTPGDGALFEMGGAPWACSGDRLARWYGAQPLVKYESLPAPVVAALVKQAQAYPEDPLGVATLLPALFKFAPKEAEAVALSLAAGDDPVARAAAIDALPEGAKELDWIMARLGTAAEYDGVQVLLPALERWKVPEARRRQVLTSFLGHPCWTARLDAWRALSTMVPDTPWPQAPLPTAEERAQLKLATRLAQRGKPVRLEVTFSQGRTVILRLDPTVAPLNVANLVRLTERGYFDGRRVPRVVPDFVVQMGSPYDTMDGGPGYTVRCEDSLTWYGPGSVGMALSGKDTGGSQFFITLNATPHLTGRYTRLGEVEDPERALPLLDRLELGATIVRVRVVK